MIIIILSDKFLLSLTLHFNKIIIKQNLIRMAYMTKGLMISTLDFVWVYNSIFSISNANGLNPGKYIQRILSDIPETIFRQYTELPADYLPWNPTIHKNCI